MFACVCLCACVLVCVLAWPLPTGSVIPRRSAAQRSVAPALCCSGPDPALSTLAQSTGAHSLVHSPLTLCWIECISSTSSTWPPLFSAAPASVRSGPTPFWTSTAILGRSSPRFLRSSLTPVLRISVCSRPRLLQTSVYIRPPAQISSTRHSAAQCSDAPALSCAGPRMC